MRFNTGKGSGTAAIIDGGFESVPSAAKWPLCMFGIDQPSISFSWGARPQSASEAATAITSFLQRIVDFGARPTWRAPAVQTSDTDISVNVESLEQIVSQSVNRSDLEDEVIPELGFLVRLRNSDADSSIEVLSITCGTYSKRVGNCIAITPNASNHGDELLQMPRLLRFIELIVESWKPDEGRVTWFNVTKSLRQLNKRPVTGWLTYLSDSYGDLPEFHPPACCYRINDVGTLIEAINGSFSPANDEHVEAVRAVMEKIDTTVAARQQ